MSRASFLKNAFATAKLLVEDGENHEYTRGVCELLTELSGLPMSELAETYKRLGVPMPQLAAQECPVCGKPYDRK